MNFIAGSVAAQSGKAVTVGLGNGQTITVARQPGKVREGASVTLGIRPEDLDASGQEEAVLTGRVFAVERLGNETYAYLEVPGSSEFAVHAAGDIEIQAGDEMKIGLNAGKCHLFDAEGKALEPLGA